MGRNPGASWASSQALHKPVRCSSKLEERREFLRQTETQAVAVDHGLLELTRY